MMLPKNFQFSNRHLLLPSIRHHDLRLQHSSIRFLFCMMTKLRHPLQLKLVQHSRHQQGYHSQRHQCSFLLQTLHHQFYRLDLLQHRDNCQLQQVPYLLHNQKQSPSILRCSLDFHKTWSNQLIAARKDSLLLVHSIEWHSRGQQLLRRPSMSHIGLDFQLEQQLQQLANQYLHCLGWSQYQLPCKISLGLGGQGRQLRIQLELNQ